jgi:hypothetical protein
MPVTDTFKNFIRHTGTYSFSVKNQQLQGIELPVLMKGTTGFNG